MADKQTGHRDAHGDQRDVRWPISPLRDSRLFRNSITGLCHSRAPLGKKKLASTGATSIEKSKAPSRANATVQAMGLNKPPFDALQRENRQVRSDDDGDGIEHRPLHLDAPHHGCAPIGRFDPRSWWPRWRTMFSTITTAPSTTIPKSSAPSDSRFAGISFSFRQMAANKQRERNRQGDDDRPAHIPEKQKQDDDDQDDALGQVVQHRVRRVVQQIAAIEERNDLHARRQNVIVQLLHLLVDAFEGLVRIGALSAAARSLPPRRRCR